MSHYYAIVRFKVYSFVCYIEPMGSDSSKACSESDSDFDSDSVSLCSVLS